jgi:hypothetical protein
MDADRRVARAARGQAQNRAVRALADEVTQWNMYVFLAGDGVFLFPASG